MTPTPTTTSGPVAIDRLAPLPPAEDFAALKAEVMAWLPVWCQGSWTDFNAHDPGIMILEQLLYGLTEASYRGSLPIDELLQRDPNGGIPWHSSSMYAPTEILPMAPLTAADYAKLLYDRIPEVRYATIQPLALADQRIVPGVAGRLSARLVIDPHAANPFAVVDAARRLLDRHANLGERFEAVAQILPTRFALRVQVWLVPGVSASVAAQNLYAAVMTALTPTARFRTLAQATTEETIDAALMGPLLGTGVLDDADLPRLMTWPEAQAAAAQAILSVPGISAVDGLSIESPALPPSRSSRPGTVAPAAGEGQEPAPPVAPEPSGTLWYAPYPRIELSAPPSSAAGALACVVSFAPSAGSDPVVAAAAGPAFPPNPLAALAHGEVGIQFTRLLSSARWVMPAPPADRAAEVGEYYSVQSEFPPCFALQHAALPADATDLRRAQVKQLKGYLLVFEQLLANYLAQLEHTADFFSNEPQRHTTFVQPLTSVPDVLPLLDGYPFDDADDTTPDVLARQENFWLDPRNPYLSGLTQAAEDEAGFLEHRGRVLDALLARFDEAFPATADEATYETIRNREDLLRAYPTLGARRAQAANTGVAATAADRRPRSGLEEKIQLLLRRDTQPEPPGLDHLSAEVRARQPADFYFVVEPIRFLPANDGTPQPGEVWEAPAEVFNPALFHVFVNWTYEPLNTAFTAYAEDLVLDNAPTHLAARFVWLETAGPAAPAASEFLARFRAWAESGYSVLQLGEPVTGVAGIVPVLAATPAARLLRWVWEHRPGAEATAPKEGVRPSP